MKINRYFFVLLLLLNMVSLAFAGGMSAWQEKTPYGHDIEHDGTAGGWICMQIDTNSVCFQHFYFYKGHTIAESKSEFFIINEKTERIQKFTNQEQWRKAVIVQKLVPLWKREYNDNYGIDKFAGAILLILVPIPLFLPLLWLFCAISLLFPWAVARGFRKHFAWVYPVLILAVFLYYNIPQSL